MREFGSPFPISDPHNQLLAPQTGCPMLPRLTIVILMLVVIVVPAGRIAADEPTTAGTTPATTTTPTTAPTPKQPHATDIISAKVDKISDKSLTVKVTYQTGGGKTNGKPNPKNKLHTVVKTMTYEIGEIPPVKIVTDGAHPTRTTGSYSDVKVGDSVTVGTRPVSTKNADGKTTTHTQVTGIDVLKHPGDPATTTTTTTKPAKN